ncbi:DUF2608 domain-containing protein [Botrimarina mediterranea]|uniref:DUF2608 domain-containing protein n=1 Tax=Botrimarina mediterranea TaxID=2528022 RepID=UPI0011898EBC|nr:hypothetical protein K2D_14770 [Planctomycetes bacterium K2D]
MPPFRRFAPLLTLLAAGWLSAVAGASEFRETERFADAVTAVDSYVAQYGAENVWLVVDIDNTLLAMQGDLGSDQWFEWQEYLVFNEPDSPELVAEDFDGLLDVQGLLFTLGKMRPPEADLPAMVQKTQDAGVATFVITSRGDAFRAATERELSAAGYDIAGHAPAMSKAPQGEFLPYELSCIEDYGIRPSEAKLFGLKEARPISLEGGVMMTAGQHKGAMLLVALEFADHPPKAIVFVDDHARHVHRIYDAMSRHDIECTALQYKAEDKNVARFRYCDKREVTEKWRRLESALKEVFTLPGADAPVDEAVENPAHATADAAPERAASH